MFALWLMCLILLSRCRALPPVLDLRLLEAPEGEDRCHADLETLRHGLDTGQLWAQAVSDASVKAPVGLMSQTAVQFGDFDACLDGSPPLPLRFCLAQVTPSRGNLSSWGSFKWGMCLPASCTTAALQTTLQGYMDTQAAHGGGDKVEVAVIPELCTTKETASKNFTGRDIAYCCFIVGVVVLVVGTTVYDVRQNPICDGISPPNSMVQCLSARLGWTSLLRPTSPISNVDLRALHGLHVVGICLVVLGHRFGVHLCFMAVTNYKSVEYMFVDSWFSIWAGHMDLIVDIFFFMSAFMLSVLYQNELDKRFVSPLMIYLQRIFRLVPAYMVVVFFYATLLRHTGDGPLWNLYMDVESENCATYWWSNLLFINTYVEEDHLCLGQSWFVSCEFQLFFAGTLLVLLLKKSPQVGIFATAVVFVGSTLAPALTTYVNDLPAIMLFDKDFWLNPRDHPVFSSVYVMAHYRGTSYLPGILAGCYVHRFKDKPFSKAKTYFLQSTGLLLALVVYWSGSLFYDAASRPGRLTSALYAGTHHSLFGFGLALLVVSFSLGKSTVISRTLSWHGFLPLSKLSYAVYLIHFAPQFIWLSSQRSPAYISPLEVVTWAVGDLVISLVAALVLFLVFENPTRYLAKFLITGPPVPVRKFSAGSQKQKEEHFKSLDSTIEA